MISIKSWVTWVKVQVSGGTLKPLKQKTDQQPWFLEDRWCGCGSFPKCQYRRARVQDTKNHLKKQLLSLCSDLCFEFQLSINWFFLSFNMATLAIRSISRDGNLAAHEKCPPYVAKCFLCTSIYTLFILFHDPHDPFHNCLLNLWHQLIHMTWYSKPLVSVDPVSVQAPYRQESSTTIPSCCFHPALRQWSRHWENNQLWKKHKQHKVLYFVLRVISMRLMTCIDLHIYTVHNM